MGLLIRSVVSQRNVLPFVLDPASPIPHQDSSKGWDTGLWHLGPSQSMKPIDRSVSTPLPQSPEPQRPGRCTSRSHLGSSRFLTRAVTPLGRQWPLTATTGALCAMAWPRPPGGRHTSDVRAAPPYAEVHGWPGTSPHRCLAPKLSSLGPLPG